MECVDQSIFADAISAINTIKSVAMTAEAEVEAQLQRMTLREKVGQLFYVRPGGHNKTAFVNLLIPTDKDFPTLGIKSSQPGNKVFPPWECPASSLTAGTFVQFFVKMP